MDRVVNAGSWHVAAEITRAAPCLRIFETHPGGGQYDFLTLASAGLHVDLSRAGSIHLHYVTDPSVPSGPLIDHTWQEHLLEDGGGAAIVERVHAIVDELRKPLP